MDAKTVYLIRHGKILQEDDQRRYIGQLDLPLAEEGVRQARLLQKKLEPAEIAAVYCSDLARSRRTAQIITEGRSTPVFSRSDLREVGLGDWEGYTFADIARRFPDKFKARGADIGYYRIPGGESFADCSKRVIAAFHDLSASAPGNILIVGHAGVNRLLICHLLGMPLANLFRIVQDYGCLNIIHCTPAGYQLKMINGR